MCFINSPGTSINNLKKYTTVELNISGCSSFAENFTKYYFELTMNVRAVDIQLVLYLRNIQPKLKSFNSKSRIQYWKHI